MRLPFKCRSNHAWDRPVAKIRLAATVCVGLFYFVFFIPMRIDDANRRTLLMPKEPSKGSEAFSSLIASHLTSSLRLLVFLPKIPVKIILIGRLIVTSKNLLFLWSFSNAYNIGSLFTFYWLDLFISSCINNALFYEYFLS